MSQTAHQGKRSPLDVSKASSDRIPSHRGLEQAQSTGNNGERIHEVRQHEKDTELIKPDRDVGQSTKENPWPDEDRHCRKARLEPRILRVAHWAVQACLPYGRMTSEAAMWMETR
jgi:hypothetical protein